MTTTKAVIKTRATGARATIGRTGRAHVASRTGGAIEIVTAPSEAGFNPLDLIYSSLAACLVLSARIAASRMGILDRIESVEADVSGEKAGDEPSRIARFNVILDIRGDLDDETRQKLAHEAEEICTVSNTLKGDPQFAVSLAG
jgi:uncharacterized OsmC-like protein